MTDLVLTTFDWVPEMRRGFVRDLRVRWALEEAGLPSRLRHPRHGPPGLREGACRPNGAFRRGGLRENRAKIGSRLSYSAAWGISSRIMRAMKSAFVEACWMS